MEETNNSLEASSRLVSFFQYFYSIKDISVGGRCVCNGHADTCVPDPLDKYKCVKLDFDLRLLVIE